MSGLVGLVVLQLSDIFQTDCRSQNYWQCDWSSLWTLCCDVSCCVNDAGGRKVIFGTGTLLTITTSKCHATKENVVYRKANG